MLVNDGVKDKCQLRHVAKLNHLMALLVSFRLFAGSHQMLP